MRASWPLFATAEVWGVTPVSTSWEADWSSFTWALPARMTMAAMTRKWPQPSMERTPRGLGSAGSWQCFPSMCWIECHDLPIYLSTYLSYSLSLSPSIYLSISLSLSLHLSIYLSVYLSIYLPIYQFTYLPICLSTYPTIYLSIYLPIHLSTYPPIYLSIHLSTYLSSYLAI